MPKIPDRPTRRQVHGIIGEWCGHFPVRRWLRVACGFIQRCTAEEKIGWDEPVKATIIEWLKEMQSRLQLEGDPVKGM